MADVLQDLRELIRENRFDEARHILKTLNHPKKADWLAKLDEKEAAFYNPFPDIEVQQSSRKEFKSTKEFAAAQPKAPSGNIFASIVRVFLAGPIALLIVPAVFIFADTQALHFSDFLMSEQNRHVFVFTAAFLGFAGFCFGSLARIIGGAVDMVAGIYYAALFLLFVPLWNYGCFYVAHGMEYGLSSPIVMESMNAYGSYLDGLQPDSLMALGLGIITSLGVVYSLGALSEKELAQRNKEAARRNYQR